MTDETTPLSVPTDWGFKVYRSREDQICIEQECFGCDDALITVAPDRVALQQLLDRWKRVPSHIVPPLDENPRRDP